VTPALEIDEAELLLAAAARAQTEDRIEYQHRLIALNPPPIETLARRASDPRASSLERQIAAWALGELDEPEACHVLDVLWLDAIDHPSETQMARAIGLARCGTLYPLRTLLNTGSLVPRLKAAMTLALLEDTESAIAIDVLGDDPMAGPYADFFHIALGLLGDASAAAEAQHLADDPLFSDYVALGLARSGLPVAPEDLGSAATGNPEPVVREMALSHYALLAGVDALPLLEAAQEDPAPRVRRMAATMHAVILGTIQVNE
jgi:HEAT repeat protein